jgi:hypothetical protein
MSNEVILSKKDKRIESGAEPDDQELRQRGQDRRENETFA